MRRNDAFEQANVFTFNVTCYHNVYVVCVFGMPQQFIPSAVCIEKTSKTNTPQDKLYAYCFFFVRKQCEIPANKFICCSSIIFALFVKILTPETFSIRSIEN